MILYTYDFSWNKKKLREKAHKYALNHTQTHSNSVRKKGREAERATDKKKCVTQRNWPQNEYDSFINSDRCNSNNTINQIDESTKTITRPTFKDFLLLALVAFAGG